MYLDVAQEIPQVHSLQRLSATLSLISGLINTY